LEGALAESWEPAGDGKSITFKLRAGAKFATGNPVRPEDVVYSFVRATKVADSQVKVGWAADIGSAFALAILSAPVASIVDEKEVSAHVAGDDFGNAWLKTNSAGSGPFKIRAYTA